MQDLDWPFNPQPGLCHFIQSSPGIREKHSTNLRLIVLIHSTFFRERQTLPFLLLFALNYGKADQLDTYREAYSLQRFTVTVGFAYLSMAAMILIGSWYPVRKAESLPPAAALRYE